MDHLFVLLAPLAALLPSVGPVENVPRVIAVEPGAELFPPRETPESGSDEGRAAFPVSESFRPPVQNQVRIEQRITIRIAPRSAPLRPFALDMFDERSGIAERRMGKCLPIAGIAGIQVDRGNRLMAFMRDRRVVSLGLEKSCRAEDFYSGFYVERSPDGQLCVGRDRLQSRSGANCALSRLRELIRQ